MQRDKWCELADAAARTPVVIERRAGPVTAFNNLSRCGANSGGSHHLQSVRLMMMLCSANFALMSQLVLGK